MKLYNSMTRTKEEFIPRQPGKVSMYVCGPTVYNHIHIGNARTFLSFDVIRRYLEWKGFDVTFVQNVTDIDDKIIKRANEEGRTAAEVATEYTDEFIKAMRAVGIKDPSVRPKATEMIDDMVALISRLVEKGHAYEVEGDVYFSVRSFPEYGKLSGRDIDDMRSGARINIDERKTDPLDFALWKAAKPGEPSWESPWGQGRPGWHIECSAMAERELGLPFDIHGGGSDLTFPHHENEIAQSEADSGNIFSNYWLHGGMLQINSEKMSKSLNNFLLLKDVLDAYDASIIRMLMLQTHYRSPLDFSDARLDEASTALDRIMTFVRNVDWISTLSVVPQGASAKEKQDFSAMIDAAQAKFVAEMDDDFNTAGALGAIFELIKAGNTFSATHSEKLDAEDVALLRRAADKAMEILSALGIVIEAKEEQSEYPIELVELASSLVGFAGDLPSQAAEALLDARITARTEKNWALADGIRDGLSALGFVIEDTASGARITFKG